MQRTACIVLVLMVLGSVNMVAVAEPVKLAEKTPIRLKTLNKMTSGKVKVGEAVPYEMLEDVKDKSGRILIAYGAKGLGKVTVSKKRGMLGKQGKLEFTVESVQAVDGTGVPLRASMESSGKSNKGTVIAAALLLTVLAVFVQGKDVTIKEGTEIMAYVDHDTMIDPSPSSQPAQAGVESAGSVAASSPTLPDAKLSVVSSLIAGTNVVGEIRNEGPNACSAEVIALIKKDGKAVGAGSLVLERVETGQTRAFSISIQGSTDGELTVSANVKPLPVAKPPTPPALSEPPSPTTVVSDQQSAQQSAEKVIAEAREMAKTNKGFAVTMLESWLVENKDKGDDYKRASVGVEAALHAVNTHMEQEAKP